MKCYFHSSDQDGHCSGAIVKLKYPECEMLPINYGEEFPWDTIAIGETVFMVDFSLPADDMAVLNKRANLIYIDHHKSAIESIDPLTPGIREIGLGACALVWRYLFPDQELPYAVRLLAEYDVWNHTNPDTLPFQYGIRLENTWPDNTDLWTKLLTGNSEVVVEGIIKSGKTILRYVESNNAYYARAAAFKIKWMGFNCVVINRLFGGSDLFESVFDPDRDDVMISFGWLHGSWKCGLRSLEDGLDVSVIAQEYGGGGHAHAAGFSCDELPFKLV